MSRVALAQIASDYEAAMLSASLLEYMLMQAITTKFIPLGKDHLDSLFSHDGAGPLCTFSAKIKLSYALGILSPETRSQIERIRIVRNHFAQDLRKARESTITPKLRYVQVCFFVCSALSNYINTTGTLAPVDCF
jgi:hypothetical protein